MFEALGWSRRRAEKKALVWRDRDSGNDVSVLWLKKRKKPLALKLSLLTVTDSGGGQSEAIFSSVLPGSVRFPRAEGTRMKIIVTVLTSYHLVTSTATTEKGEEEAKIFHNNPIIWAASGRWKLITSWFCCKGIIQTHAGAQASENYRVVDCWTYKQQHGSTLKGSVLFSFFFSPDCGCGFINLWLHPLSDMLYSCSMLDLSESDCTLSEETDHVELSCDAPAGWALDPRAVR